MTYEEFIKKPISEKSLFCWIEPTERLIEWSVHSGSVYKKVVDFTVIEVSEDGSSQTNVSSLSDINSPGKWFYENETKTLYFRSSDDSDPTSNYTVCTYRIPFSDRPNILPVIDGDGDVEYLPLIKREPSMTSGLDKDQTGLAIESRSAISMINDYGSNFWVENYDKLTWSNKRVLVYSWSPKLDFSERQVIFDGIIEDINYSNKKIDIKLKDFLNILREPVPLGVFESSDGDFDDSVIGKTKRRIYGRVVGLKTQSLDQVLDGFTLTGKFTAASNTSIITGTGSNLLDEATPEDTVIFNGSEYKIESVDSDTQITVSETIENGFFDSTVKLNPEIQTVRTGRNKNFFICGHRVRTPTTTIVSVPNLSRIEVADTTDFNAGEQILVDGTRRQIRRISGSVIVLSQTLISTPSIGSNVVRLPVQVAYVDAIELTPERDYTVVQSLNQTKLVLDDLVEFNTTPQVKFSGSVTFTNSSRVVTLSGINAKDEIKPRDWVKPDDVSISTWYEVLAVNSETEIELRTLYSDTTTTDDLLIKKVKTIKDESVLTVDTLGKTEDGSSTGNLIKTASEVVKDLLTEAGLSSRIDSDSFDQSKIEANFLMSLAIPSRPLSSSPKLRNVINDINKSVFGSLYTKNDMKIAYSILSADKDSNLLTNGVVNDDDIISWDITTSSKDIVRKVVANYRHQDSARFSNEKSNLVSSFINTNVDRLVSTNREEEIDVFLYEDEDAETIAQRFALFNETSRSTISIKAKMDYILKQVNDTLILNLEKLYNRFGATSDNRKIAFILNTKKSGFGIDMEVDDISNIFNRSANVAEDGSDDYTNASDDDLIMNGYIADENELINNKKNTFRTNLIT